MVTCNESTYYRVLVGIVAKSYFVIKVPLASFLQRADCVVSVCWAVGRFRTLMLHHCCCLQMNQGDSFRGSTYDCCVSTAVQRGRLLVYAQLSYSRRCLWCCTRYRQQYEYLVNYLQRNDRTAAEDAGSNSNTAEVHTLVCCCRCCCAAAVLHTPKTPQTPGGAERRAAHKERRLARKQTTLVTRTTMSQNVR